VTLAPYHIMNQLILAANTTIMKLYHLMYYPNQQQHERALEHHQNIQCQDRVVDNHASSLRGPELKFWARKTQTGHPNFQHILQANTGALHHSKMPMLPSIFHETLI